MTMGMSLNASSVTEEPKKDEPMETETVAEKEVTPTYWAAVAREDGTLEVSIVFLTFFYTGRVPLTTMLVMAYFHQRSRIRTQILNPIVTLCCAEVFPLHRLGFGFGSLS